jgi:hypothetical protein
MPDVRRGVRCALVALAAGVVLLGLWPLRVRAQRGFPPAQPSHVVIPFLANATKPADLDFEGGECEVDPSGVTMECQFQQVMLTTSDLAPSTCLITTNRYQRTFQKQGAQWVSREGPTGVCGIVDVATLRDDGGVRWTMETRKVVGSRDASPQCRALGEDRETLSWQNIRRALPCTFVQPAGLSR